jgi:hypothetical protein
MTLDRKLMHVPLSRPCPNCGHNLTMKGSWFYGIRNYQYALCQQKVRMTMRRDSRCLRAMPI